MDSMLKFMRLMLMAPDTNTKRTILDVSHQWFLENLDPKIKRKNKIDLEK